jgi:hypothetical protein
MTSKQLRKNCLRKIMSSISRELTARKWKRRSKY